MNQGFSRRDISILITNLLDHFGGALYGFLAPVMSLAFFPDHDPVVRIILAYSMLATSVVTRPMGAIIFGILAKNKGPILPMTYSLIGISICSLLLAVIPSYNVCGYYAAISLLLLRFIRGIFSSGESAIAKLYILDGKKKDKAFKASILYHISSMCGIILASIMSTFAYLTNNENFWRYCYLVAGIMGIITCFIRRDKRPFDKNTKLDIEIGSFKLLWQIRYPILAIIFTTGLSHITYFVPFVIMNSLVPMVANIAILDMMRLNSVLLIVDMILIIALGRYLTRYNIIGIKSAIPIILGAIIPILFWNIQGASIAYVTFVRICIVMLGVVFMIPQNIMYNNMFKDLKGKYLIIGVSNSIGAGVIGKLSPALIFYIYYKYNNIVIAGFYISAISFLTAYFVLKSRKYLA